MGHARTKQSKLAPMAQKFRDACRRHLKDAPKKLPCRTPLLAFPARLERQQSQKMTASDRGGLLLFAR